VKPDLATTYDDDDDEKNRTSTDSSPLPIDDPFKLENDDEPKENIDDCDSKEGGASLSKRALKRLKKKEIWMANKGQRRAAERERRKRRAAADKQKRIDDPENAPSETFHQFRKKLKKNRMSTSSCRVSVVIDCDWENLMDIKDIQKLAKQIQYSYTTNRRLDNPLQFFVTGLKQGSMLKRKLDNDYAGYTNWDVYFKSESYDQCFEKEKIVYLTSESENTLDKLEEDKVYIIGGLVDHNQHKGVCHSSAVERGFAHARLPIDEFMDMKTRKVLTVNHVFDILASASNGNNWKDAFVSAIPSRKGAVAKEEEEGGDAAKTNEGGGRDDDDDEKDDNEDEGREDDGDGRADEVGEDEELDEDVKDDLAERR